MIPRHHRASWRAVAVVAVLGTLAACSGSDAGTAADTTVGTTTARGRLAPTRNSRSRMNSPAPG